MEHLIKRYRNRRLYDTEQKKYVNLNEIHRIIQSGETVKIIDNQSGKDITQSVLIQVPVQEESHAEQTAELEDIIGWFKQGNELFRSALKKTFNQVQKIKPAKKPPSPLDVIGQLKSMTRHVPTQEDWNRVMLKLDKLEKKITQLKKGRR